MDFARTQDKGARVGHVDWLGCNGLFKSFEDDEEYVFGHYGSRMRNSYAHQFERKANHRDRFHRESYTIGDLGHLELGYDNVCMAV